jgi:porphobilinogen synthase
MPGVHNLSVDQIVREAADAHELGVRGIILFGLPESKDESGSGAYDVEGIVQQAIRAVKKEVPELLVIADTCLCEYTSHGHCGVVQAGPQSLGAAAAAPPLTADYEIVNDASLELLARTAVSQARAGVHSIAPSAMMDGRVGAIRKALTRRATSTPDPFLCRQVRIRFTVRSRGSRFRTAVRDRRSHQMDPANIREAMREIELDIAEGADMVMVKPAMPYLDVIAAARQRFGLPLAAYQVSGEYAMIEAAARNQWIDRERVIMESLLCIRRAGADIILTYYAQEAAKLLT